MTTGDGAAQAVLEIHSHLAGRRDGTRIDRRIEIVLRIAGNTFTAETVNISRSGVLLGMKSGLADQGLNLPYFALQVQCHFADGCEAILSGHDKPVTAKIVRATEREGHLLVAFRFDKRLPPKVCKALGIPVSGDDSPEPAQE
jgi:hypothetical protein